MTDYDSPWKEMLDDYFPAFMAFFFPEAYRDIDWDHGYESLDKELQQIVRDAELGKRLADKLMKVWRLSGEEQMVMIHTEIQAVAGLLGLEDGAVTGGVIRFDSVPTATRRPHELARAGLCLVMEGRHVFEDLTVEENLTAATYALTGRRQARPNFDPGL